MFLYLVIAVFYSTCSRGIELGQVSVNQSSQQEEDSEYEELDTCENLKKDLDSPESYDNVRPPPQPKSSIAPPTSDEYTYVTTSAAQEVMSNHGDDTTEFAYADCVAYNVFSNEDVTAA